MCSAAPLTESSGDPGFQQFIQKNREFVSKIKRDVASVKERVRKEFKLGSDSELLLVRHILGIEQADHSHCQKDPCDMEGCFNQIQAGLHTYHSSLSHIGQILSSYTDQVSGLQLDILNLSINIQRQMEESGMAIVTYPQAENLALQNQREIGSYLILGNLQKFMEATLRALRHCRS
ncbi:myelomonocytic growth factor-like isoform X2 [Rhineura floridana]|nr:myelomonocytic growth factor-like isoform X2 [Rhineura floridana]